MVKFTKFCKSAKANEIYYLTGLIEQKLPRRGVFINISHVLIIVKNRIPLFIAIFHFVVIFFCLFSIAAKQAPGRSTTPPPVLKINFKRLLAREKFKFISVYRLLKGAEYVK